MKEKDARGISDEQYFITGASQNRPLDMKKALKSESFKKQLPSFLMKEWENDCYAEIIKEKRIYVSHLDVCKMYFTEFGKMYTEKIEELCSDHDEADTKICLHAVYEALNSSNLCGNIVIHLSDTDVAIIMLYHISKFDGSIFMKTGCVTKNSIRYINLTAVAASIGSNMCRALPGLHAITGCDYTSAFYMKGKSKALKLVRSSNHFQEALCDLANQPTSQTFKIVEELVCQLYVKDTSETDINTLRYKQFLRAFGTTTNKFFQKLKSVDGRVLPPCRSELLKHIRRSSYVARMWGNANLKVLPKIGESDGWSIRNGNYDVIWFDGLQVHQQLVEHLPNTEDQDEESDDDFILSSEGELETTDD